VGVHFSIYWQWL